MVSESRATLPERRTTPSCKRAVTNRATNDHFTAQMPRSEVAMEGSTAPWVCPWSPWAWWSWLCSSLRSCAMGMILPSTLGYSPLLPEACVRNSRKSSLPVGFGLVYANCCLLAAVVCYGDVEPPRLGNEQRRTSPFSGGGLAERFVMVGILLRKDPDGTVPARDVDELGLGVVEDVVRIADGAEVGYRLSRLGVKCQQQSEAPGPHEQA